MFILGNVSFLERCVNRVNLFLCPASRPVWPVCSVLNCCVLLRHLAKVEALRTCSRSPELWRSRDAPHIWCHSFGVKGEDAEGCHWPFNRQTLGRTDWVQKSGTRSKIYSWFSHGQLFGKGTFPLYYTWRHILSEIIPTASQQLVVMAPSLCFPVTLGAKFHSERWETNGRGRKSAIHLRKTC